MHIKSWPDSTMLYVLGASFMLSNRGNTPFVIGLVFCVVAGIIDMITYDRRDK